MGRNVKHFCTGHFKFNKLIIFYVLFLFPSLTISSLFVLPLKFFTLVLFSFSFFAFITLIMWRWLRQLCIFEVSVVIWMFYSLQIGVWNSQTGLNLTEKNRDLSTNVTDSMANRTLIVTTILVWKIIIIIIKDRQHLIKNVLINLMKSTLCLVPGKSLCHV